MIEPLNRNYRIVCGPTDSSEAKKLRKALLVELKSRVRNSAYEQDLASAVIVKLEPVKLKPIDSCFEDLENLNEEEVVIFFNPLRSGLIATICQNFSNKLNNLSIYIGSDTGIAIRLNREKIHILDDAEHQFLANSIVQISKDSKKR